MKLRITIQNILGKLSTSLYLLFLFIPYISNAQLSGTYQIGSSASANYSSFTAAVNALSTNGINGAVVFNVENGSYTEQIKIKPVQGASATNTISFQSLSGDSTAVTLQYNASPALLSNYVIYLDSADHFSFKKMTIKALNISISRVVLLLGGADSNEFSNNIIECSSKSTASYGFYSGIMPVLNGVFTQDQYNRILNNRILNGSIGIYFFGADTTNWEIENIIQGNIITDFAKYGIQVKFQKAIHIKSNTLTNYIATQVTTFGIQMLSSSLQTRVENNIVHIQKNTIGLTYGIVIKDCIGTSTQNGICANNFLYNTTSGNFHGIRIIESVFQLAAYNTVNIITGGSTGKSLYLKDGSNISILNNNLVNTSGGYSIYILSPSGIATCNYNNLYATGTNLAYWGTTDCTNLASWKSTSGKGSNSISANPLFYNNNAPHISSILLNGAATPISLIQFDFDGESRHSTNPDIGADEFSPITNDAGITSIIAPLPPCIGVANAVIVNLKNFSSFDLNSVKINWSINDTLQTQMSFTDTISAGFDTNIILGNYTFYKNIPYRIKVWTSNPNNNNDQNTVNDTFFTDSLYASLGGTFTIGGANADFHTFSSALNAIKNGICSSVIFKIDSGSYTEQISIPEILGLSPTRTITFESATLDSTDVVLQYSASNSADNYVVKLNGADYITFRNLSITATGTNYSRVVVFENGADNNHFYNNIITGLPTNSDSSQYAVIYSPLSYDINNIIENNLLLNGSIGILYEEPSTILETGHLIYNNHVKNFSTCGIHLSGQLNLTVSNNIISSTSANSLTGIYTWHCDNGSRFSNNQIAIKSTELNTITFGMDFKAGRLTGTKKFRIDNNFVSVSGFEVYGISVTTVNNPSIYYNSVNIVSNNGIDGVGLYLKSNFPNYNAYVKNNNIVNAGGGYAIEIETSTYVSECDYNNLFVSGVYLGRWGLTNCSGLNNWSAASSFDQHSISADPVYASATDLHVASTAVNAKGTPLFIIYDIDRDSRDSLNPDIGADEFFPPAFDAGIDELSSPVVPCSGNPSIISVRLVNYGVDTITSIAIRWSVNDTMQGVTYYADSLANLNDTILIIDTFIFYAGNQYDIKVWTEAPAGKTDGNSSNDTLFIYQKQTGLKGVYTIGGNSPDFKTFTDAANMLNSQGICSAVTFYVREGTYNEQLLLKDFPGSSALNYVSFLPDRSNTNPVVLSFAPATLDSNFTLRFDGTKNITVKGFTLKTSNTNSNYASVINFMGNTNYITLDSNIIEGQNASNPSSYQSVIAFSSQVTNFANNTLIQDNIIRYGNTGINLQGCTPTRFESGNKIINNQIESFTKYGIIASKQDAVLIHKNTILSKLTSSNQYGIYITQCKNKFEATSNLIEVNASAGLSFGFLINVSAGTAYNYGLIANNFVTQKYGNSTIFAIRCNLSKDVNIFHNTIKINSNDAVSSALNIDNFPSTASSNVGNINIQNNIAFNNGSGFAIDITSAATAVNMISSCSHNDYYSTNGSIGRINGGTKQTLYDWEQAFYLDHNSISVKPVFVSNTDLHLSSYTNFQLANPIQDVMTDIDGNLRSLSIPTIGADEIDPIPDDAGIIAIANPFFISCEGNNPIVVELRNYGSNLLDSVTINWSVNDTLQTPFVHYDSLSYTQSREVIIGSYSFIADSVYRLLIFTSYPNGTYDSNSFNDTFSSNRFQFITKPELTLIKGDSICHGTAATLSASANTAYYYWYNSANSNTYISKDSFINSPLLYQNDTFYVEAGTMGVPHSIITSNKPDNFDMGIMFDVITKSDELFIDSIYVQPFAMNPFKTEVYFKQGSHSGFEANANAWTFLDSSNIQATGISFFTAIRLNGFKIPANDTIAFYITSTDLNVFLNTNYGQKTYSDNYLTITPSKSIFYPFDTTGFSDKVLNMKIHYSTGSLCRSSRQEVIAYVKDTAFVELGVDTSFCDGDTLILNAGNGTNYYFDWKELNSSASLGNSHSISVTTSGNYYIKTDDKCGFSAEDTIQLIIHQNPVANAGIDQEVCFGDSVQFTASGGINYFWNTGDSTETISFIADTSANYSVILFDSNNCTGSDTVLLSVFPLAIFNLGNDTSICNGEKLILSPGSYPVYNWNNGLSTADSLKVETMGLYFVEVTDTNSCTNSDSIYVTVKALPEVNLGNDTILLYNLNESILLYAGAGFDHYLWSDNSGNHSLFIDTSAGLGSNLYWVQVLLNNCAGSDTIIITFKDNSSIPDLKNDLRLLIFPNPSQGYLNITFDKLDEDIDLSLYNASGKLLITKHIAKEENNISLNLNKLSKGSYFLKFIYLNRIIVEKIMID